MELPRFNPGDYASRYLIDITCKGGGKAEVIARQVGGPSPPKGATEYDPVAVCDGRLTTVEIISRGGRQDVTIDAPQDTTYTVAVVLGGTAGD